MRLTTHILLFFLSGIFWSCKEPYYPDLNATEKVLVVDGLVTNEPGKYSIRLTKSIPFDSIGMIPESGALVYVTENENQKYYFAENTPGLYLSDSVSFATKIGSIYQLHIETKDGQSYISSKQKLLPIPAIENIVNYAGTNQYTLTNQGRTRTLNVQGTKFLTTITNPDDTSHYYRFSNTSFVESTGHFLDYKFYFWQKFNLNEYFDLNNPEYNRSSHFVQNLGFCPVDTNFYGVHEGVWVELPDTSLSLDYRLFYGYTVSFIQYHLNSDVYTYYLNLNKQLAAKMRFLDPVPFQVKGNISCTTNPQKLVFGVFEVSSIKIKSVKLDTYKFKDTYHIKEIAPVNLDKISSSSFTVGQPPSFWIY